MKRILIYLMAWAGINLMIADNKTIFVLLSLLIIASSVTEVLVLYKKYGTRTLLSTFAICCLFLFALNLGISNLIFIIPGYEKFMDFYFTNFFPNSNDLYYWLYQSLNYTFVGLLMLIAGYYFEGRVPIVTRFTNFIFKADKLLIRDYDIQLWKILVLWFIACTVRIYAINAGLYGFTASSIALEENKGIIQILVYGSSLAKGVMLFLSLLYFIKPKEKKIIATLILVVVVELIFGLLSGFKSQIMYPFIILFFANIIVTRRVKVKFIVPVVLSVFLAYALVEPMRAASDGYQSDRKVGASELVELATSGVKSKEVNEDNALPFFYVFMSRNSLTMHLAIAVKESLYRHRLHPHFDLQRKMLYAPILAYVPRAVWPDKPIISNGGVLFNRELLGAPDDVNVSMALSPFGFFFLDTTNTLLYIIGFFFILGMLQRYIFELYLYYGLGGLIVCLGTLVAFGLVEEPYAVFISYFKELPIFILFQFLFLYKFNFRPLKATAT